MCRFPSAELLAFATLPPSTALAQGAAAEAAIHAVIAEQVVAWNSGDGIRYANHLAPGASFTNLFRVVRHGSPDFACRHNEILSAFHKGTRKQHVMRRTRFLASDIAIVGIDNRTSRPCRPALSCRRMEW